jgi:ABC-type sugar transport system ATPase subunit
VDAPVSTLTIGERQLVEICRVLLTQPRLLILDEPNSALSLWETERLFTVLRALRGAGMTMLYVSHRLEEVFDIADRITVMRNGRDVLTRSTGELTIPEVIESMIGAHQEELFPPRVEDDARPPEPGAAGGPGGPGDKPGILRVRDLSVGDRLSGVSFEARPGEVVGLAGLEGSGVAQVLGALFGTVKRSGGEIELPDGKGAAATPTAAARRGIALVPADRRVGLMTEADVAENVAHVTVGALRARSPWLRRRELHRRALRQMGELQIKAPSPSARVDHLSGGNQQKVVLAKGLETGPSVVLLDDPTRGVDVGAKREIYGIVRRLSADGRIVVFRSSELPELAGLADRILVFYRGRLVGEVTGAAVDSRALLHAINTGELAAPTTEGDRT